MKLAHIEVDCQSSHNEQWISTINSWWSIVTAFKIKGRHLLGSAETYRIKE